MNKDNPATIIDDDLKTIPECAKILDKSQTTFYTHMRSGKLTTHFLVGDTQPKISLSEARQLFEAIGRRRRFTAPTFRIVRHGEDGTPVVDPEALPEKSDLFA
jgi:hypothetical protein